jgi:hypothetical protein
MTPAKLAQVRPKAAVSPAAWLDQMAADAGHQHLARIAELLPELKAQAQADDFAGLAAVLQPVAQTLSRLDFGLLQPPGFFARLSGKGKNAGAEFAAQFQRIEEALRELATSTRALQGKQASQSSRTDRSLLELEVEFGAMEKIHDQGARWLQDMRNQLKSRTASATDEAARESIAQDTARCEILVARLKALRAASSSAQQLHQQAKSVAARRAAFVQILGQAIASDAIEWRTLQTPLATSAREGRTGNLALEAAMESHRELQLCIKQAIADCAQLQVQQQALGTAVEALGAQLRPAATTA